MKYLRVEDAFNGPRSPLSGDKTRRKSCLKADLPSLEIGRLFKIGSRHPRRAHRQRASADLPMFRVKEVSYSLVSLEKCTDVLDSRQKLDTVPWCASLAPILEQEQLQRHF